MHIYPKVGSKKRKKRLYKILDSDKLYSFWVRYMTGVKSFALYAVNPGTICSQASPGEITEGRSISLKQMSEVQIPPF